MNKKVDNIDLRNFWLIWLFIFLCFWLYPLIYKWDIRIWSLVVSVILLIICFTVPVLIRPFYQIWIKFWNIMWWINSRLIMFILFFFIFTPVALVLKLLRKDLLRKKLDKKYKSYWIKNDDTKSSMNYQF